MFQEKRYENLRMAFSQQFENVELLSPNVWRLFATNMRLNEVFPRQISSMSPWYRKIESFMLFAEMLYINISMSCISHSSSMKFLRCITEKTLLIRYSIKKLIFTLRVLI